VLKNYTNAIPIWSQPKFHGPSIIFVESGNDMRTLIIGCIALMLYTWSSEAKANFPGRDWKTTVSLESKIESDGIALILNDDQIGVYNHFILEKSLDGKTYFEVARVDEMKDSEGTRKIKFKDFPFEKNSISCIFYRIRAVDEFGWFDFTNTVTVMKKQEIAKKDGHQSLANRTEGQF
jgi:hypothetical protein